MEPRIELNGGTTFAPPAAEPVVTAGFDANVPPGTVVITEEAEAHVATEPKSGRRGPAGGVRRTALVAWIVASVLFASASALTVTAVGEHGRLTSARAALAAERTGNRSLEGQISDLTSAKAGLESKVAQLQGRSDDVGSELGTCVRAVNSMDRLINAMLDALNATSLQSLNREIQRVNRLAQPASDARAACLAQPDAGTTSM
jgi:hypothetical protein